MREHVGRLSELDAGRLNAAWPLVKVSESERKHNENREREKERDFIHVHMLIGRINRRVELFVANGGGTFDL